MSLEIENVKNLPLLKRQAMLACLVLISKVDGNQTDLELREIHVHNQMILGLSSTQIKNSELKPKDLAKVLNQMSEEELIVLGILMGKVAQSDGIIDDKELEWIHNFLKIGNLHVGAIAMVLLGVKKAANSN